MARQINRPATAFSLDSRPKGGRVEDPAHLAFIRTLPCLVSGRTDRVEAAHLRYGDPAYRKPKTPMARKPDDRWAVPLCAYLHRESPEAQHQSNERVWWEGHGFEVLQVAIYLHSISGDRDAALRIIQEARARAFKTKRGIQ